MILKDLNVLINEIKFARVLLKMLTQINLGFPAILIIKLVSPQGNLSRRQR